MCEKINIVALRFKEQRSEIIFSEKYAVGKESKLLTVLTFKE
jgi:hypothetical protein